MDPREQLSQWIDDYSDRLLRIAYIHVKDRLVAEDRVQDAFIKAYQARPQLSDIENAFPWLARIVVNECRSYQRKSWREIASLLNPEHTHSIGKSTEEMCLHHFDVQKLHEAVLSLPDSYRLPIMLFHFEELSIHEISNLLKLNPATVRTRLFRGRQYLRNMMEEEHDDESNRRITDSAGLL